MGLHEVERTFPKPNNAESEINGAKRTATNYIAYDPNTGLMIADMSNGSQTPSTATSRNVLIDSDSVDFRNGQDVQMRTGSLDANNIGMELYDEDGDPITTITGQKIAYLDQNVPVFEVESSEDNPVITIRVTDAEPVELTPEDASGSSQTSITSSPSSISPRYYISSVGKIDFSYYWNIATSGFPSGSGKASLVGDNGTYELQYNDQTIATFSVYKYYTYDYQYLGMRVTALRADLAAGLTVGFKLLGVTFSTSTVATSRVTLGAYPDKTEYRLLTVGNGVSADEPSNAFTIDWEGNVDCENLFFHSGERYGLTYPSVRTLSGLITTSTTEMHFEIPLPKRLDYVYSVTITSMYGAVRGISGYVDGKDSNLANLLSGYTVTAWINDPNTVKVRLKKSSALSNATNNTPIVVALKTLIMRFD